MPNPFPREFKWGVATASYQIEGSSASDGRGTSIWDTFSHTSGKTVNGDTGDVACDHYRRYAADVALMRELAIQSYRFSISWPRIFPNGDEKLEPRGFDFYDRLVDELLEAGISPMATLYHWDLPQALQDRGGWANRETAYAFASYAEKVAARLGDRVEQWVTLNEPWCVAWLGYMSGVHAPGIKNLDQALAAAHHTALAHGLATRAIRSASSTANVGLALNMTSYRVDDPGNADLSTLADLMDAHVNRWWLDAFTIGAYPRALTDFYGPKLQAHIEPGDEDILRVGTDFLGINYYSDSFLGVPAADAKPMQDGGLFPFPQAASSPIPEPKTAMGWPITASGIRDLLLRVSRDWPSVEAIAITENGAAFDDVPSEDGRILDHQRANYLTSHIAAVGEAVELGAPVVSYHAWSFLDNFEWAEGYSKRFGLVYVDYESQNRTPKLSAEVYRSLILAHASDSEAVQQPVG